MNKQLGMPTTDTKKRGIKISVSDSGLFVSTEHPYLGASPDGLATCDCCGAGGCEIKVLICARVVKTSL